VLFEEHFQLVSSAIKTC